MRAINLGFVGAGRVVSSIHLPALAHVDAINVVALADEDRSALEQTGARFSIPKCVADYRDMLNDSALDAVAICTPAFTHIPIALAALQVARGQEDRRRRNIRDGGAPF